MCGRVTLAFEEETLFEILKNTFSVTNTDSLSYTPRYNIAPGSNLLAIINDGEENRAGYLRWGFVPSWSSDPTIGYKMVNARSEEIEQKRSYLPSYKSKRCILLVDSFYEWKTENGIKQPFRFILKDRSYMPLAGIYSTSKQPDQSLLHTCSILTTSANPLIKPIHHRMPVILQKDKETKWLNRSIRDPKLLKDCTTPYPYQDMHFYPVSKRVNQIKYDDPFLLEEVMQ